MVTEQETQAAVDLLPQASWLKHYVAYGKEATDAPIVYHVAGGFSCLSQLAAPTLAARAGSTAVNPNLFFLLVGKAGESRKTSSIELCRATLRNVGCESQVDATLDLASAQGLEDSFAATPQQLIFLPEFGDYLNKSRDVRQGGSAMMNATRYTLLKVYDCLPLGRALAKRAGTTVKNPRGSLLAGCALKHIEDHTSPIDWEGGFFSRFVFFQAERERYTPDSKRFEANELIGQIEGTLRDRDPRNILGSPAPGPFVGFTPEAAKFWDAWNDRRVELLKAAPEAAASCFARGSVNALKMATLLALDYGEARSGQPWRLDREHVAPACAFMDLHFKSAVHIAKTIVNSQDMVDRRRMLRRIEHAAAPMSLGDLIKGDFLIARGQAILNTLLTEGTVTKRHVDGRECFVLAYGTLDTRPDAQVIPFPGARAAELETEALFGPAKAVGTDESVDPF